jgi:hypothetical protein
MTDANIPFARRGSANSDSGSFDGGDDTMSTISESFGPSHGHFPSSSASGVIDKNHICGYLLKQSKDGVWQKRYFETNGTFLTYYKSKKMTKLLAALNMPNVGEITLVGNINDNLGEGVIFQLELKDRNYVLRAKDMAEAQRWMRGLTVIRNESKANSIPEERETCSHDETETASSSARGPVPASIDGKKTESSDFAKADKKGCCVLM